MIDIHVAIHDLVNGEQGVVELDCLLFGEDFPRIVEKDEQPLSGLDFTDKKGLDPFLPVAGFTNREMWMRLDHAHRDTYAHLFC